MAAYIDKERFCYIITKGDERMFGYLFADNVRYWESQGYTCTKVAEWPKS